MPPFVTLVVVAAVIATAIARSETIDLDTTDRVVLERSQQLGR